MLRRTRLRGCGEESFILVEVYSVRTDLCAANRDQSDWQVPQWLDRQFPGVDLKSSLAWKLYSSPELGGRPLSKTLVERLLGKPIQPEQQKYIDEALSDMLGSERKDLEDCFQVEYWLGLGKAMNSSDWRAKSRRVPKRIRYLIKKFRLTANYYLRDVPMPKPYTVEYHPKSQGEQDAWCRRHSKSDVPCPPREVSVDVRSLPGFNRFESKHKQGVIWTVKDIVEAEGGQWTEKRAAVAIKWLNATYPPGDIKKNPERQKEEAPSDSNQERALPDQPGPADYPGNPRSGESLETDQQSNPLDSQGPAEFEEEPEFPPSDESAELPHDLTRYDLPELKELQEPPDFLSSEEPPELAAWVDPSDIPLSE